MERLRFKPQRFEPQTLMLFCILASILLNEQMNEWVSKQGDKACRHCPDSWCWGWMKQRTSSFLRAPSGAGTWGWEEACDGPLRQLCPPSSWAKGCPLWAIVIYNPGNSPSRSGPWQQIRVFLRMLSLTSVGTFLRVTSFFLIWQELCKDKWYFLHFRCESGQRELEGQLWSLLAGGQNHNWDPHSLLPYLVS